MLNNIEDPLLLDAVKRLRNDEDFKRFLEYLEPHLHYLAVQAVKSVGIASDEFSGAYKFLEQLLSLVTLKDYDKDPAYQYERPRVI